METKIERIGHDEHRCWIRDMEAMLETVEPPELVPNCCIYKVPQTIREPNEAAYTPKMVSIGPFHHGEKRLEEMEDLKLRYLKSYLKRNSKKVGEFVGKLKEKEENIRSCYAGISSQSNDNFVEIILTDACFIIEHFLRFLESPKWKKSDPILSNGCRMNIVKLDLILLENQLPFFVLEDLFTPVFIDGTNFSSFLHVSFRYFIKCYDTIDKSKTELTFDDFCGHHGDGKGEFKVQHFTDLLRIFHLPTPEERPKREVGIIEHLYSASQLMEAGVEFKFCQDKSLIEVEFKKGKLTMRQLPVHDHTKPYLLNMAALEQCHYPGETYIGDYLHLLDLLINNRKDADIMVEKRIIICIGDIDYKVATAFNNIGRGMILGSNVDYLEVSRSLNEFFEKPQHKYKAIFIRDYLSTPWKIASFIAAIILLLLTLIQTVCSIVQLRGGNLRRTKPFSSLLNPTLSLLF